MPNSPSPQDVANMLSLFMASDPSGGVMLKVASGSNATPVDPIAASTTAAANKNGTTIDGSGFKYASFQLNGTSLSAADGVFKLQDSNDGTNWNDITGATITVQSGTTTNMIRYTANCGRFIRPVWTANSNVSGTIQVIATFK